MEVTRDSYDQWIGAEAIDSDGDKIGEITDIYFDNQSQRPEWIAVKTGMFGARTNFAPLGGAQVMRQPDDKECLQLNVTKDQVKDAPSIDAEGTLTAGDEQTLYKHYGFDWNSSETDRGFGTQKSQRFDANYRSGWLQEWNEGRDQNRVQDVQSDSDVVATETVKDQQAVVQERPETVRLRKYQWTEQVPVQREEVRVEKEQTGQTPRHA